MRIAFLSFNYKASETDPYRWLEKIRFYNGTLEALAMYAEVYNLDLLNWKGTFTKNGVQYVFPDERSVISVLKKTNPDIVVIHGLLTPIRIIQLRFHLGKKRIIVQHHAEKPLRGIKAIMQRIANRYIERYFFTTDAMADQWVKAKLVSRGKVETLPEASSVFHVNDKKASRNRTGVNGEPVYLWVGRLNENKDPLTVISAFARFAKDNASGMLYMIYSSSELLEATRKLIIESGMENKIILIGRLPHEAMLHWYNSADFIINSSYYEGCNIAVMEGMSCGCIPIVTIIPSFGLHTDNGRLGLHFEPGSISGLTDCLNKSVGMQMEEERKKVLTYFDTHLSFRAIAEKIYSIANTSC